MSYPAWAGEEREKMTQHTITVDDKQLRIILSDLKYREMALLNLSEQSDAARERALTVAIIKVQTGWPYPEEGQSIQGSFDLVSFPREHS
jgi:hypothetical protein